MKRLKDEYLTTIQTAVPLIGKAVLEVGCGNGSRSIQIAALCNQLVAVEPNTDRLSEAKQHHTATNIEYRQGSAESLPVSDAAFDVVLFTLSLHHVPSSKMSVAIDEAIRAVKPDGHIIFFEPAFEGSFFESEIQFDACDGDERREKALAYAAMLSHDHLKEAAELEDETIFSFDSVDDFRSSMNPKQGSLEAIDDFLRKHNFLLSAQRRINVFRLV